MPNTMKQIERLIQSKIKKANKATAKKVKADLKKKEKEVVNKFYSSYLPQYYVRKHKLKSALGDIPNTYDYAADEAQVNLEWGADFIQGEPYESWTKPEEWSTKEIVVYKTLGQGAHGCVGSLGKDAPKVEYEREVKEYINSRAVHDYYNSFFK